MNPRTLATRTFLQRAVLAGTLLLGLPRPIRGDTAPSLRGLDSGMDAIGLAGSQLAGFAPQSTGTRWVRLRGINSDKVAETRIALLKLRADGLRSCIFLRLPGNDWIKKYLPEDLREAYENGRRLGATYGDLVDAWEVDNEPDLGFVPESAERYTAFLKAMYLGLKAGIAERAAADATASASPTVPNPLVIMGALGLPPGPWLERFAANDGFAYTDAYTYHYYGYADDFTAVYQQHAAAVRELTAVHSPTASPQTKSLPVFLTEIGYGLLGKQVRDTKDGRLRQWRWFKSVGEQATRLRIEAPLGFYLPPYLEYDTSEYGLTVPAVPRSAGDPPKSDSSRAGDIDYTAADFGAADTDSWTNLIGKKIGDNEATPALSWWLAGGPSRTGKDETNNESWTATTAPPSPVVIDFIPDEALSSVKRYHGSFVFAQTPQRAPQPEAPKPGTPKPTDPQAKPPLPSRSEEYIIQIRTASGNLFEVYPTRQATPDWQSYLEPCGNFTMAFYGRAALPWRFAQHQPAALVLVMYPKQLPATYELRRAQVVRLGGDAGASRPARYGHGRIVLYNFSKTAVTGRLVLPDSLKATTPETAPGAPSYVPGTPITLAPMERIAVSVLVEIPGDRYASVPAAVRFEPEASQPHVPTSRYFTAFIPDIAGMPAKTAAPLMGGETRDGPNSPATGNRLLAITRTRAAEEAPMSAQAATDAFAQAGAVVTRTSEGISVTVTSIPPGKPQRIEVDIPWPDGLEFTADAFLSLDVRLR